MSDQETINNQLERLEIYRRNLRHLLIQAAQHGGEARMPLAVFNDIHAAREQVRQLKLTLRTNGVPVADVPEDGDLAANASKPILEVPTTRVLKELPRPKKFSVFLRHSGADESWVIQLKEALQARGLNVWLDHHEVRPGDHFGSTLAAGYANSDAVALIISLAAIESGWVREEHARVTRLAQEMSLAPQLIPVLIHGAQVPDFLADRRWVDFQDDVTFDASLDQLIWGITGKRPAEVSPKPTKSRALLDRRLATELVVLFSAASDRMPVHNRTPGLLISAIALFEDLLVENVYGSTLALAISRASETLREAILLVPLIEAEQDEDFAAASDDSGELWSHDPKFQLIVSRYDQLKGSTAGNVKENVAYLQHSLHLARQLDAAIIPHPDRWSLYHSLFENCLWTTGDEFPGQALVSLPDPVADPESRFNETRVDGLSELSSRFPNASRAIDIVRYGPMPYPFPPGLVRHYEREDLARFEPFLYEFCIPSDAKEFSR